MYLTFRYRIKNTCRHNWLKAHAMKVNRAWNDLNQDQIKKNTSKFDLMKFFTGKVKTYQLNKSILDQICIYFGKAKQQTKKSKLQWRIRKRQLYWIPFVKQDLRKLNQTKGSFVFMKKKFEYINTRSLPGKILCGSFNQDSLGNWFVSFVCEVSEIRSHKTNQSVGIDLGLKNQLTTSDGMIFQQTIIKDFAQKLAQAQRAHKKKQVTKIHQKIKNKRKDWAHKTTTEIIQQYDQIFVGDIKSNRIKCNKKLAKSVYNAAWFMLKTFFKYKAQKLGKVFQEVVENYSTVTCSVCSFRTGPSGLSTLGVRTWKCSNCGSEHHRDVNAAQNILRFALNEQSRLAEVSLKEIHS